MESDLRADVTRRMIAHVQQLLEKLGAPRIESLSAGGIVAEVLLELQGEAATGYIEDEPRFQAIVEQAARMRWSDTLARYFRILRAQARLRWEDWNFPRRLLDADDLVQGALARAHEKRMQFQGESDAEYCRWLLAILETHALDQIDRFIGAEKRNITRERSFEEWLYDSAESVDRIMADSGQPTASSIFQRREIPWEVLYEIDRLSPVLRETLIHSLRGKSVEEIAAEMELSPEQIQRRIRDAAARIRKRLDHPNEDFGDE